MENDRDACATCGAHDSGSGGAKGHGGASGDASLGAGGRDSGGFPTDASVALPVDAGHPTNPDPCTLNSGYAGDDTCIVPPAPADGFQLHYGPADYTDPVAVAAFILPPGEETVDQVVLVTPNAADEHITAASLRTRPGAYLFSMNLVDSSTPTSTTPKPGGTPDSLFTAIGGANEVVFAGPDAAPENQNVGLSLPARAVAALAMHAVNTSDQPLLKEGWANVKLAAAGTVTAEVYPLTLLGGLGMAVPPGQTRIITAGGSTCTNTTQTDLRLLSLLAENHSSTTRAATSVVGVSGPQKVYENYDWHDPFRVRFDSITPNPAPNGASRTSGGLSGILLVHPGDQIAWECEIQNTLQKTLTYAQYLFSDEMCNVHGYLVGGDAKMTCTSP